MKKYLPFIFILLNIIACGSCGYLQSGTWEDDPDNWKRAFRSRKPEDVVILHSYYFRSPHFTYEFQYYFEIASNDQLKNQLFTSNELIKLEDKTIEDEIRGFENDAPDWFLPNEANAYEGWRYKDEELGNFRVFIDKETGNLYLTDYLF